jgi:hypothetical protein
MYTSRDTLRLDLLVLGFTRRLTKLNILLAVLACGNVPARAQYFIKNTGTNVRPFWKERQHYTGLY